MNALPIPRFACDAMLGRLARWLRAAGYDTSWQAGIPDWDLIRHARDEGRTLLTSDTGIHRVGIVRDGEVRALFVPHGLSTREQLAFILTQLGLPVRPPRCMACGGELAEAPKAAVAGRVPERSYAWQERFWECRRCDHVFWQGTHWRKIADELEQITASRAP